MNAGRAAPLQAEHARLVVEYESTRRVANAALKQDREAVQAFLRSWTAASRRAESRAALMWAVVTAALPTGLAVGAGMSALGWLSRQGVSSGGWQVVLVLAVSALLVRAVRDLVRAAREPEWQGLGVPRGLGIVITQAAFLCAVALGRGVMWVVAVMPLSLGLAMVCAAVVARRRWDDAPVFDAKAFPQPAVITTPIVPPNALTIGIQNKPGQWLAPAGVRGTRGPVAAGKQGMILFATAGEIDGPERRAPNAMGYYHPTVGLVPLPGTLPTRRLALARWHLTTALDQQAGALATLEARDLESTEAMQRHLVTVQDRVFAIEKQLAAMEAQAAVWEGVFLPEQTLADLLRSLYMIVDKDPAAPSGTLLYGPPGTGKTEIARRLAKAAGCAFVATNTAELKAGHVGGTEELVKALWVKARAQTPCILFIDECDSSFPDRSSPTADAFAKSITEGFLAQWQGLEPTAGIWVVGATNHRERLDTAIMSRFSETVEILPPTADARAGILAKGFADAGLAAPVPDTLVDQTAGASGRDLMNLAKALKRAALLPGGGTQPLTAAMISNALASIRGRASTKVDAAARWETLVLAPATERDLQRATRMLQNAEVVRRQGIAVPRGILLYGPPGTGKTQIARTMANESGLAFFAKKPSELKGTHVGQSAPNIRAAFDTARANAPSILFFDELDAIAPVRGTGDQYSEDIVSELLQQLDGAVADDRIVFVLGATNRPDNIDPAVRSRFERTIEIPLPDQAARVQILQILLRGKPVQVPDPAAFYGWLGASTEGYAGRDLKAIVDRAGQRAFERAEAAGHVDRIVITPDDFVG
jgi:SpoVK/Ycf46/Vps4 family AAA+-type ATPase